MVGGEQEQEQEADKATGKGSVYEPDWDRDRERDWDSRGRGGDDWRSRSASADLEEGAHGSWTGRSGRDKPSRTIHIRVRSLPVHFANPTIPESTGSVRARLCVL